MLDFLKNIYGTIDTFFLNRRINKKLESIREANRKELRKDAYAGLGESSVISENYSNQMQKHPEIVKKGKIALVSLLAAISSQCCGMKYVYNASPSSCSKIDSVEKTNFGFKINHDNQSFYLSAPDCNSDISVKLSGCHADIECKDQNGKKVFYPLDLSQTLGKTPFAHLQFHFDGRQELRDAEGYKQIGKNIGRSIIDFLYKGQ